MHRYDFMTLNSHLVSSLICAQKNLSVCNIILKKKAPNNRMCRIKYYFISCSTMRTEVILLNETKFAVIVIITTIAAIDWQNTRCQLDVKVVV